MKFLSLVKSDLCVRKEARWSSSFRFIPAPDIPHHPCVPVSRFLHLRYAKSELVFEVMVASFVGHFTQLVE